jgi:hypothetical protein
MPSVVSVVGSAVVDRGTTVPIAIPTAVAPAAASAAHHGTDSDSGTESGNAITIAKMSSDRIDELGAEWLHEVLDVEITSEHIECGSLIVNRDFIPSGWVYDARIPVVDMEYLQNARNATFRQGLKMLHNRCNRIQIWLEERYPTKLGGDEMRFGAYTFDLPVFDLARSNH